MKQFISVIICLIIIDCCYSQNKSIDPISINVEIIHKGDINFYGTKCNDCYLSRLEIFNNEDTTIPITIWTCSWSENWEGNKDSIFIQPPPVCTANFPTEIDIPSKKSLVFYGDIYLKPKLRDKLVKIGFTNMNGDFKKFPSKADDKDILEQIDLIAPRENKRENILE